MLFLGFCLLSASELSITESQGRKVRLHVIRLGLPPASDRDIVCYGSGWLPQCLKLWRFTSVFEDCWLFPKDTKQKERKWVAQKKDLCSYSRTSFWKEQL